MEYKNEASGAKQIRLCAVLLIMLSLLMCCGCASEETSAEFFSMDTVMTVTVNGRNSKEAAEAAVQTIAELDARLSIGLYGSEIYELNENGGGEVSADTASLIKRALDYSEASGGLFDITVYPVVELWGFYSGEHYVPSDTELKERLKLVGADKLTLDGNTVSFGEAGMGIDLGGIAKGLASELAAEAVRDAGARSAILSLGGNVYAVGSKPDGSAWSVAVQDPDDRSGCVGVLELRDVAAVTSGAYQRFFERGGEIYHHIIDPRDGYPSDSDLKSVTVVSKDAVLADAYSTALFIMGEDDALDFWRSGGDYELVLITKDNRIIITPGLDGLFISQRPFEVTEK